MECLEGFPGLKVTYHQRTGLSGFADSNKLEQHVPELNFRKPLSAQEVSDALALEAAGDRGAIRRGRSGGLLEEAAQRVVF